MAYIYRNARIILELGPGCGYDIGAYRKCSLLIAVNSHACYTWTVNDISDCNTCLFSVAVFFFFFSLILF